MCGIVGYVGQENARDVVVKGLAKLEYRGYDSAGLAIFDKKSNQFNIFRNVGRVEVLNNNTKEIYSSIGVGHTRWATHGRVTESNAHPHSSSSGRFIVVHNGIIENYLELKEKYLSDITFASETDTEVISQLIEKNAEHLNVEDAIIKTIKMLEGSYAILVLDNHEPGKIFAAKDKPPLIVGKGNKGFTITSDIVALAEVAESYHVLSDKTFIVATENEIKFYDYDHRQINLKFYPMKLNVESMNLGNYEHYMLKEIYEQPSVIRRICEKYYIGETQTSINPLIIAKLKAASRIHVIGAGTSRNAGIVGKRFIELLAHKAVEVHIASEFAYQLPIFDDNPVFLLISQSGETADLRSCLKIINDLGYESVTITNVPNSTLAREATHYLKIYADPEIGVAATKTYTAEISVLAIIAYELSDKTMDMRFELENVAFAIKVFLDESSYIKTIVEQKIKKSNLFYIGRGIDYATAAEAALKLKEISYVHAEGFPAGELKHGTIALIEEGTPVIALISEAKTNLPTRSSVSEVVARGAIPIIITLKSLAKPGDDIVLTNVHPVLSPILMAIPTQLIAYYAALVRGFDIDKPRNLAKSVTVE